MEITNALVLAADTSLLGVDQLSGEVRRQIHATKGDYVVMRPCSRTHARLIDRNAARLLEEFRLPTTIIQAIIRFCKLNGQNAASTLDAAFPMLYRLVRARLLVVACANEAPISRTPLEIGTHFAGTRIVACLQTFEDTEVYRVETSTGESAALKLFCTLGRPEINRMFEREMSILKHLDFSVSPKLLDANTEGVFRYLLVSWCHGPDCGSLASRLRSSGNRAGMLSLCVAVLNAYVALHAQKIIHSDVHPHNILVESEHSARILDFGMACFAHKENARRRGGVSYFLEPEYAKQVRDGHSPPSSSFLGEQYSLAALLYLLITGVHYVDFCLERQEMLRQIAEDDVLPFAFRGIQAWPTVERILSTVLSKRPTSRFKSVAAFAAALAGVGKPLRSASPMPAGSHVGRRHRTHPMTTKASELG